MIAFYKHFVFSTRCLLGV